MSYEHKNGMGNFFKNEKTKDTQPDYNGDFKTPEGTVYKIAGWIAKDKTTGEPRKDAKGNPFINLKIELKDSQGKSQESQGGDLPF